MRGASSRGSRRPANLREGSRSRGMTRAGKPARGEPLLVRHPRDSPRPRGASFHVKQARCDGVSLVDEEVLRAPGAVRRARVLWSSQECERAGLGARSPDRTATIPSHWRSRVHPQRERHQALGAAKSRHPAPPAPEPRCEPERVPGTGAEPGRASEPDLVPKNEPRPEIKADSPICARARARVRARVRVRA